MIVHVSVVFFSDDAGAVEGGAAECGSRRPARRHNEATEAVV